MRIKWASPLVPEPFARLVVQDAGDGMVDAAQELARGAIIPRPEDVTMHGDHFTRTIRITHARGYDNIAALVECEVPAWAVHDTTKNVNDACAGHGAGRRGSRALARSYTSLIVRPDAISGSTSSGESARMRTLI